MHKDVFDIVCFMNREMIIKMLIKIWDIHNAFFNNANPISIAPIQVSCDVILRKHMYFRKGRIVKNCNIVSFDYNNIYLDTCAVSYDHYNRILFKNLLLDECPTELLKQIVQNIPVELKIQYDLNEYL